MNNIPLHNDAILMMLGQNLYFLKNYLHHPLYFLTYQEWTIAQKAMHVTITLRVLTLTPSTRVPVVRASTEMGINVSVSSSSCT